MRQHSMACEYPEGCSCGASEFIHLEETLQFYGKENNELRAQRDALLKAIKPIVDFVFLNDHSTFNAERKDDFVITWVEDSWNAPRAITLGQLRAIAALSTHS